MWSLGVFLVSPHKKRYVHMTKEVQWSIFRLFPGIVEPSYDEERLIDLTCIQKRSEKCTKSWQGSTGWMQGSYVLWLLFREWVVTVWGNKHLGPEMWNVITQNMMSLWNSQLQRAAVEVTPYMYLRWRYTDRHKVHAKDCERARIWN